MGEVSSPSLVCQTMRPSAGQSRPCMRRMSVVLPAPLWPSSKWCSPRHRCQSMWCRIIFCRASPGRNRLRSSMSTRGLPGTRGDGVSIQNSCRIVPDGSQPSCGTSKKGQPAGDRTAGNRSGAPARKLAGDPRCGHARGLPRMSLFRIRRAGEGMEDWGKGNSSRAGSDPMAARRAVPVSAAGASGASTVGGGLPFPGTTSGRRVLAYSGSTCCRPCLYQTLRVKPKARA